MPHIVFSDFASQEVQQEPSGSALVLCEVHLLWPVSVPDQMWLPEPHPGQLSHQELQLPEPLPLPRVRKMATFPSTDCSDYHWIQRNTSSNFCVCGSFLQLIFEITWLLKLFFFPPPVSVWFPSWLSWGRWWTGFGPTPLCRFPTGFVLKTSMPTYLFSSAGGSLRK